LESLILAQMNAGSVSKTCKSERRLSAFMANG